MDRNNALASLDAAQREVASHISKARELTRGLPHGASGLDSTKRVMGSLGRESSAATKIPSPMDLAEELYSGSSDYGASLMELRSCAQ